MYCERVEEKRARRYLEFLVQEVPSTTPASKVKNTLPHMASSSSDASSSTPEPPPLEGSAISKMFDTTGNAKEKTKCEELVETATSSSNPQAGPRPAELFLWQGPLEYVMLDVEGECAEAVARFWHT